MTPDEIQVLTEQLDELLAEGLDDPEEALEVASMAGMLARSDVGHDAVREAAAWRDGSGSALLEEAWALVDGAAYADAIDVVSTEDATDEEVEEAVWDLDEIVAAAVWCKQTKLVAAAARSAEQTIRMIPEPFAGLAAQGRTLARLPRVARDLDVYGFWLAIADSDQEPT